ncbi:MAG TPA: CvpA family protein [Chloroflexia bacterium]|nr:CvpA family protein [Chloroflexia bacterium]
MDPQLVKFLQDLHMMDIFLFGVIIAFAFLGFTKGMVKLFIILSAIWVGFVVASIYYVAASRLVTSVFNISSSSIADILAFFLINVVVAVLLIVVLYQFFGHLEIQGRAGACIDRPIGMLLGFLTGILITALLVILIEVPYNINTAVHFAGTQAPYLLIFNQWYESSVLGPTLKSGLPILLASISPLVGGHLPALLTKGDRSDLLPLWMAWVRLYFG